MKPIASNLLVAVAIFAFASPALAQESTMSLVAKVVGGLVDEGEMLQGTLGKGVVNEIAEGAYEIGFSKGVASFLYDEPEPCVFIQHSQMEGEPTSDARFDFNVITAIEVQDQGEWEGLKAAVIQLQGPETAVQMMQGDTWVTGPNFAFLVSSITADELKAAAAALREACPGG